jgi:predicted transcriptional regulator of viral defense system
LASYRVKSDALVTDTVTMMTNMTRTLPGWLAPVVEQLELDQLSTVTVGELRAMLDSFGISVPAKVVAQRLRERGWLLATGVRGVYEFAPAAHAGPVGRGDPFGLVHAVLASQPETSIVVALGSAAWAHGLADRTPELLEVAFASSERASIAVRRAACPVTFDARLAPEVRKGVPVQALATMLVHMAAKPRDVRAWGSAAEWLGDAAVEAGDERIMRELEGRPESVQRRLGYLIQGVHPQLARRLRGSSSSKVWFGPRGPLRHHDEAWGIADTVLPFAPSDLVRGGDIDA